jgi:hypothetical protein
VRGRAATLVLVAGGLLSVALAGPAGASSLRFFGHGGSAGENFVFPDRVKILVSPPSVANIGAGDFTIEFFLRSPTDANFNAAQPCGFGIDWVNGNILIDRDRYGQGRKFGIALLDGRVAFGASDSSLSYTLCGATDLRDDAWHHVAVERRASDGRLRIWLDGLPDAEGPVNGGPTGDMSYPAAALPGDYCSPDGGAGSSSCENSDPYLVFGAEKHGFGGINFTGWLDEIHLSSTLRYTAPFPAPTAPFSPDGSTLALYHLDEGQGSDVLDASPGSSDGTIFFGGDPPAGPVWSSETPVAARPTGLPALATPAILLLAASFAAVGTRILLSNKGRPA